VKSEKTRVKMLGNYKGWLFDHEYEVSDQDARELLALGRAIRIEQKNESVEQTKE